MESREERRFIGKREESGLGERREKIVNLERVERRVDFIETLVWIIRNSYQKLAPPRQKNLKSSDQLNNTQI